MIIVCTHGTILLIIKFFDLYFAFSRAVVAVLDNFHFDLSSVTHEDTQAIKPHLITTTPTDGKHPPPVENGEEIGQETRKSEVKEDEAMEVEESLPTPAVDKDETDKDALSKNTVRKILKAIVHTIIPNLQKVLTKRVRSLVTIAELVSL